MEDELITLFMVNYLLSNVLRGGIAPYRSPPFWFVDLIDVDILQIFKGEVEGEESKEKMKMEVWGKRRAQVEIVMKMTIRSEMDDIASYEFVRRLEVQRWLSLTNLVYRWTGLFSWGTVLDHWIKKLESSHAPDHLRDFWSRNLVWWESEENSEMRDLAKRFEERVESKIKEWEKKGKTRKVDFVSSLWGNRVCGGDPVIAETSRTFLRAWISDWKERNGQHISLFWDFPSPTAWPENMDVVEMNKEIHHCWEGFRMKLLHGKIDNF